MFMSTINNYTSTLSNSMKTELFVLCPENCQPSQWGVLGAQDFRGNKFCSHFVQSTSTEAKGVHHRPFSEPVQ